MVPTVQPQNQKPRPAPTSPINMAHANHVLGLMPLPELPRHTFSLDTYVYAQDDVVSPLAPPPGVQVDTRADIKAVSHKNAAFMDAISAIAGNADPNDNRLLYAYLDPRVHVCRTHPKEWYTEKLREIRERGGRRVHLGQAASRLFEIRKREAAALASRPPPKRVPNVWVGDLPPEVVHNAEWVSMLEQFARDDRQRYQKQPPPKSSRSRRK